MNEVHPYVPGLAGIPAAESSISYIDGEKGVLEYRGHRIETLAAHSSFEETAWMLAAGRLPRADELARFRAELRAARELPRELLDAVRSLPTEAHPMVALQASVAALGAFVPAPTPGDAAGELAAGVRLIAALPVLVAAFHRHRRGLEPIDPDPELDTAADFLRMLTGEPPAELAAHVLDVALILHADHTMNASTFAARVVASTEAEPCAVMAAAVGALYGPLHGGANERVLTQLERIGSPAGVPDWVERRIAERGKVMGFGHRVYKTKDPRATILQGLARQLFDELGTTPIYEIALALESEVVERLGGKGIHPNVDFFSGIVYDKLGIPTDLFTPVFAIARVAGWVAHWHEQMASNKLFRPRQVFVGSHGAQYVDIGSR